MHQAKRALILTVMIAAGAGCLRTTSHAPAAGVPQLVLAGPQAPDADVDFGPVQVGMHVQRDVGIANLGKGRLTLRMPQSGSFDRVFGYAIESLEIPPGGATRLSLTFSPDAVGAATGSLTLQFDNASPESLSVRVRGEGADGVCTSSATSLEFPRTTIGDSSRQTITLSNKTNAPIKVTVSPLDPTSGFGFGSGFAAGVHTIPAASPTVGPGQLRFPLVFTPRLAGEVSDALSLTSSPVLCPTSIPLHGSTIDHALECEPVVEVDGTPICRVDFGNVNPGTKAIRPVTFRNLGSRQINLTLASVTQPASDSAAFAIETVARSFGIATGGASVSIDLSFGPAELGEMVGRLNFISDDPNRPTGYCELVGVGGSPKIEAQPGALDFGEVATDCYQIRVITITNVGTSLGGTTDDNLRLAVKDGAVWKEKRAEITGQDAAEFTLDWPPQGYPENGLSVAQSADLLVHFAPTSPGVKTATVVIYSSDPERPQIEVPISGVAVNLPMCTYEVQPASLNFGSVESNQTLTLRFTIFNRDSDPRHPCRIFAVDRSRATARNGAFALVNGPIASATINSGEHLDVPVRFQPTADGTYSGEIEFYASSPLHPRVTVALSGIAEPACLMIAPRELDFATVGVNCNSRQRVFNLYNSCSSAITINSIDLQPGSSSEFAVTKRAALPLALASSGSADLGVTYHPVNEGVDFATLAVRVSGNVNPYVISLSARGATVPIQTDTFSSPQASPKIDFLVVVDNTSSMTDKQASLARNFGTFVYDLVHRSIDYHVAVTTTNVSAEGEEGRFVPLTGSNPRVVTPSTPNKEQVLLQNLLVGTNGATETLLQPVYLALTDPLITGHNAGFYRDEAKLAVIVVSDAADMDPLATPVGFYESFLYRLKGINRRGDVTFNAIIPTLASGPGSGCSYDTYDAGQDPRITQLVQRTGGVMDEICNVDWSRTLSRVIDRSMRQVTFWLSGIPDMTVTPDPIVITADGIAIPQYGSRGQKNWDYDAGQNALVFEPLALPDPGVAMTVTYHVACL